MTLKINGVNIVKNDVIRFDKVNLKSLQKHFLQLINAHQNTFDQIINDDQATTFQSVILPLEHIYEQCYQIKTLVTSLFQMTNKILYSEYLITFTKKISEQQNKIYSNKQFYKKIKQIYKNRQVLSKDDQELLIKYYNSSNKITKLSIKNKNALLDIESQLSELSVDFLNNNAESYNNNKIIIKDFEVIKDIPAYVLTAAKKAAIKNNKPNAWIFQGYSDFVFLIKYCHDPLIREKGFLGIKDVSYKDKFCNYKLMKKFISLTNKKAHIFKNKSYADFILKESLIKNKRNVNAFLEKEYYKNKAKADNEFSKVLAMHNISENTQQFKYSDQEYYMNLYKKSFFNYSNEEIAKFFNYSTVKNEIFDLLKKMHNIDFIKQTNNDKKYSFLEIYKVYQKEELLGTFYFDSYTRKTKVSGFFTEDALLGFRDVKPHILISLDRSNQDNKIEFEDIKLLMHEIGHGLSQIFCKNEYINQNGLEVNFDFVEVSSLLLEKYLMNPKFLRKMSWDDQNNKKISISFCQKIIDCHNMFNGLENNDWILLSKIDIDLYSNKYRKNIVKIEESANQKYSFYKENKILISPSFEHSFDGTYSSRFYCYLYSDVLANQIFSLLKKDNFSRKSHKLLVKKLYEKITVNDVQKRYKEFKKEIKKL